VWNIQFPLWLNGSQVGYISYVPDLYSTPQVRRNRKEDTLIAYPALPRQRRGPHLEGFVVFCKVGGEGFSVVYGDNVMIMIGPCVLQLL
jgi:hypothetical protein